MPEPLNANVLHLSMPALPATPPSQGEDAACASRSMLYFTLLYFIYALFKYMFYGGCIPMARRDSSTIPV